MSDPDNDLPELDELELDPVAEPTPADPSAPAPAATAEPLVAEADPAGADDASGDAPGQWVWQYAAPAPPPSFGAVFFSGSAQPELYRFFACGLLVVLGCLLPWGPTTREVVNPALELDPDAALTITEVLPIPEVLGFETTLGAVSLAVGLFLVFSSLGSIYTRRQKILPVFLMLEPAFVSWTRFLEARDITGDMDLLASLDAAGTGLLLTLVGSTLVSAQFLLTVGKVYTKKDDKGAARRGGKDGKAKKGKDAKDGKDGKDAVAADDAPTADAGAESDGKKGKGGRGKRR